jgi:hypothetical protein
MPTEEIDLAGVVAQLQNENEKLRLYISRLANERSFDWQAVADFLKDNYVLFLVAAAWAAVLISFIEVIHQQQREREA